MSNKQFVQVSLNFDEVWTSVEPIFQRIICNIHRGLTRGEFMETYNTIFVYLCQHGRSKDRRRLGGRSEKELKKNVVYTHIENLVVDYVQQLSTEFQDTDGIQLTYFKDKWNDIKLSRKITNNILSYLNRTWVKANEDHLNIYPINLLITKIWQDKFLIPHSTVLTRLVLQLIQNKRNGDQINESLISAVTESYLQAGEVLVHKTTPTSGDRSSNVADKHLVVYQQYFETSLLSQTEEYYRHESTNFLEENGLDALLDKILERLDLETIHSHSYLHPSTKPKIIDILRKSLIFRHREVMYDHFVPYLNDHKIDSLSKIYRLLLLLVNPGQDKTGSSSSLAADSLDPIYRSFEGYIISVGQTALIDKEFEASEKPEVLADILLSLYKRFTDYIHNCFQGDSEMINRRDKAFRFFIKDNVLVQPTSRKNTSVAKIPQLLARYADLILKKGPHHISDDREMDLLQTELVTIFSYLPDKDVFILAYSKLMSRRLINDLTANNDYEIGMISKIKTQGTFECGHKLQKMIQDMETSRELNQRFQQSELGEKPLDFQVYVLATNVWPLSPPPTNFVVPSLLRPIYDSFNLFYKKEHGGRKLCFLHHLSKLEMTCKPLMKGRLRLTTTVYQGCILLLMNDHDRPNYEFLKNATQLNIQMLKVALLGFLKIGLLRTNQKDHTQWDEKTLFALNPKFQSKKIRVNCNVPVTIPGASSQGTTNQIIQVNSQEVKRERELKLQACIVRIMKARKTLVHNELITETTDHMNRWFVPQVNMIKKVIESLIESEYLERVVNDEGQTQRAYNYLA